MITSTVGNITLCWDPDLEWFLRDHLQQSHEETGEGRSVKDLIEACGVPHTEILRVAIGDADIGFDHAVQAGDTVTITAWTSNVDVTRDSHLGRPLLSAPRFIADVHLGRLVRYLRMLGLDCKYEEPWDDDILAASSAAEQRIMLTRDVGLLKRKCVEYGMFLHSDQAIEQARQLITRIDVSRHVSTLSRCASCNGLLVNTPKADVEGRVHEGTYRSYDEFYSCQSCDKVYWRGAHGDGLTEILDAILANPA